MMWDSEFTGLVPDEKVWDSLVLISNGLGFKIHEFSPWRNTRNLSVLYLMLADCVRMGIGEFSL